MEAFTYEFMQRAFLVGIATGLMLSILSVIVVLKKISFIGVGISHSTFSGLAIATYLSLPVLPLAFTSALIVSFLIGFIANRKSFIDRDIIIGIMFSVSMAVGILFMNLSSGNSVDIMAFLFGSILAVSSTDAIVALMALLLVFAVVFYLYKEIQVYCFDETWAEVSGINIRLMEYMILGLISTAVVLGIKLLGVILVSALLVIPGAIGLLLAPNYGRQFMISAISVSISVVAGLLLSYRFDLAPGAMIVILLGIIFSISLFAGSRSAN